MGNAAIGQCRDQPREEKMRKQEVLRIQRIERAEIEREKEMRRQEVLRIQRRAQSERITEKALRVQIIERAERERIANEITFANCIDYHIRSQHDFDDSSPLTYKCNLSAITQVCDPEKGGALLGISTLALIRRSLKFIIHDNGSKI